MSSPVPISQLSNSFKQASLSPKKEVSTSPTSSYLDTALRSRALTLNRPKKALKPFSTGDIKMLILENINQTALSTFHKKGYQVEFYKTSLPEEELIEKIKDVHVIGIRSKTKLTANVLKHAKNLIAIGCFCIGTNQVDLEYAGEHGIAVFNSPFCNSRSVAEMTLAEIIFLSRQMGDRSMEMHQGVWNKKSAKCWEVRGKTLGIVGYGHIGSQLSVLTESLGMHVLYYDILSLMSLGNSEQVSTLDELLSNSDFVTLHVPETPETKNMISTPQLAQMKDGAYLLNNCRGSVVDIPALVEALKLGKLAGAALDVYPAEPRKNGPDFQDGLFPEIEQLKTLKNVILTPHIGGSTEEAQSAIGIEVSHTLSNYINEGTSTGAVNFPEVALRGLDWDQKNAVRVLYIHQNVPGVLKTVNQILSDHNIEKQFSDSRGNVAYLMTDISDVNLDDIKNIYEKLEGTPFRIITRILY
ncbi:Phosphoglycerate dehydrogenase ser3 [Brettanomyces nanus]|uniref:2-oxoglutarate reductase n=1 Tax=Eeniella nana TaxID=13502 RepID=A0A875RWK4_EENNA|nr:Phosphoglycerate dehydrogenase ser3 [Brettanomyces nanus]QPG73266.1 Phosphoglycerate dehydrogenase ser3 [Brettanomyces nanus]